MAHPIIHLESLNILTNPRRANIFEIIAENKKVSFNDLIQKTGFSNDGLSKNLKHLFENYLIKVAMSKSGTEKFSYYTLTQKGEYFHKILHDVFVELASIPQRYVSNLFVLDANSFSQILEKTSVQQIAKMFRNSKIVFTNTDFSKLLEKNEENNDLVLEEFLYSEELVIVPTTYKDTVNGVMCEFYLRKSKKLSKDDSQVIATAVDLDASIISSNPKLLQAAKSLGILCVDIDAIQDMDEAQPLNEQFYELANKTYDPTSIEFLIEKNYPEIVKKNYNN